MAALGGVEVGVARRAGGVGSRGVGGVAEAAPFVYVVSGKGAGRSIVVRAFVASRGGVVDTPLRAASRRDRVLATTRSMDLLSARPAVSA